jgi:hypothetical protein
MHVHSSHFFLQSRVVFAAQQWKRNGAEMGNLEGTVTSSSLLLKDHGVPEQGDVCGEQFVPNIALRKT